MANAPATTNNLNVYSTPFLDFRINVKSNIETLPSAIKNPFYTMCYLIPKSSVATFLVGTYEDYVFYNISEADYATKCTGEFLKGATTFYNQPHTEANIGIVIFEDSFSEDPQNPNVKKAYLQAKQENRLLAMTKALNAIGRNAVAVGVAEANTEKYDMMMDDFRQADTLLTKLKIKVRNSLSDTEANTQDLITDFEKYGGTLIVQQANMAQNLSYNFTFENRADFMIPAVGLNPYQPLDNQNIFKVGMNWDGLLVNIPSANIQYNIEKDTMRGLTEKYITYFEVLGDDNAEVVVTGCGVYYQGKPIPANIFLLAKFAEYTLQTEIFNAMRQNKLGVANVSIYRNALNSASAVLSPYVGTLLQSMVTKSYTQTELNNAVINKTLKLQNCINITSYPTLLFTEASVSVLVQ